MTEQRPNEEVNPVEPEDRLEEEGDTPDGPEPTDEPEHTDEEDTLERLRAERDNSKDQHLRLAADFDNYRKRTEDRLRQRWNSARADLVSRLLDPLDDLLRVTALEPETASVEAIVEGVDLVERKFFRVLEDIGVEIVDPAGETFDPNTMEAMMQVPAESEDDDETVAQVFQRGYALKGLLVRPARVSVYKA
ncbi:MAG: nucleotide exchange factor GrpE [Gemmatimonadetes bacterium]|nr:nucleotide exchange factor GrpE [Gemmatimonadota bacterium]MCY3613223.1 nucleotide exchange factor GrpE [Gemmatimonadota bacterium]MCY3678807.1 nucleotide exchange factor GrpE [Gemmatimonadota bacterium]MYA42330.1 nucleotide exchange factor GrpE [Gemmatimonadota bacterium]MYE92104.1 nucleotide exchange factor GrpE [Gemmatimonadota bacterium]